MYVIVLSFGIFQHILFSHSVHICQWKHCRYYIIEQLVLISVLCECVIINYDEFISNGLV